MTTKKKKIKKVVEAYPLFDFDYKKVIEYTKKMKSIKEMIIYLEYVLKEKNNSEVMLDVDLYSLEKPFGDKIKNEIKFLKAKLKIEEPTGFQDKIVWMKNKQDFVALFDKLFSLGFIGYRKNKYKILSNHFAWSDGEIKSDKLKQLLNNINHKSETHQIGDETKAIITELEKNR